MDIRSTLAAQSYSAAKPATKPQENPAAAAGNLATSFVDTLRQGETTAASAMTGGASAHSLVQALAQTELAVETAVTVRDKVVEAYQEILRMPV